MNRIILYIFIGLIVANHSLLTFAQESIMAEPELESKLLSIKNPFKSQLPQKEPEPDPVVPEQQPHIVPPPLPPEQPVPPKQIPDFPKPKVVDTIRENIPTPEIPVPSVTITGIIWNSDRPQAIINGQIVDIGDTVSDLTITDIQQSSIKATFHGKSVTIKTQRSQ